MSLIEFNIHMGFKTTTSGQTQDYQGALFSYPTDFSDVIFWAEISRQGQLHNPSQRKASMISDPFSDGYADFFLMALTVVIRAQGSCLRWTFSFFGVCSMVITASLATFPTTSEEVGEAQG